MSGWRVISVVAIAGAMTAVSAETPGPDGLTEKGRLIYEAGQLGSGEPLVGYREGGLTSSGKAAACVVCHQRSGFGLFEGSNLVPPITGPSQRGRSHTFRVGQKASSIENSRFSIAPPTTTPPSRRQCVKGSRRGDTVFSFSCRATRSVMST
jgi:hypothetical protein